VSSRKDGARTADTIHWPGIELEADEGKRVLTSGGGRSFAVDDAISGAKQGAAKLGASAIRIIDVLSTNAGAAVTADALQCTD